MLWSARPIAPTPGTARMQQPQRAEPRQSERTVQYGEGKQPQPSSPFPRAPHTHGKGCVTAGRAVGQRAGLWDSGQGAGLPAAGCRDTNSREQHYRKQLCSLLGSLPGVSTREPGPARPEGEGKSIFLFSLTVLGAQREGEEGLDKDPILDSLISKAPLKPEAAQVQPKLKVSPSLPACSHLGVGREGAGTVWPGAFWATQSASCTQGEGLRSRAHQLGLGLGSHRDPAPATPANHPPVFPRVSPQASRAPGGLYVPPQSQCGPAITW